MRLACILAALVASVASRPQGREKRDSPQCSDFADQGYNCVLYDRCDELGEEITDGAGNFDIREGILKYFWCCRPY